MIRHIAKQHLEFRKKRFLSTLLKTKIRADLKIQEARRFLCIQMNSIGDAIMSQPAWTSLKTAVPDSDVDLICRPHIAPLFKLDPSISRLYTLENRRFRSWLFDDMEHVEEIVMRGHYDLVIDFTENPLTASLCAQRFCPPSIGFRRNPDGLAHDVPLASAYDLSFPYHAKEPVRALFMRLVSPWVDMRSGNKSPVLYFEDLTLNKAMETLRIKGLLPKHFIVAHPGAKWPPRRWPLLYWRVLIEKLKDDLPYPVLLLGGPEDSAMIHGIAGEKGLSSVASLVSNDTALSSAIMKMATLCVCNDSGAMHIAAAVGTPSISLFGPGHPQVSAPPRDDGCQVLYDAMFCSPCSQYYSRTRCRRGLNFCMHAISPERVYCEIEKVVVHKEGEVS